MKKVTSKDVAKLAGVSQTTVSFVLNNRPNASISQEIRDKVWAAAKALDYLPPVRSAHKRALTLGLMVPTLSNLYYPFIVQCLEIEAKFRGINIVVMDILRDEKNERFYFDFLQKGIVDGILSLYTPYTKLTEDQPVIIASEYKPGIVTDTVALNSHKAGYIMADHMLSLGRQDITYISTPFYHITSARRQRLEGICTRMKETDANAQINVLSGSSERELTETAYEYNLGYELTGQLLSSKAKVNAIIAVNDTTAAGCVFALQERGVRIPEDIAVGGFDNLLIARMLTPQLTSVDQMASHACRIALDMLIDKINNPRQDSLPVRMEYQPHLIVRGSTDRNVNREEVK